MKTYRTGNPAPYGLYVSARPLDIRFVGAEGESLDGLMDASYVRLPTLLLIAAGPVLGGIFVMAFPVLIILATLAGLFRLATGGLRAAAGEHAYLAKPRYEPMTAYLHRKDGEEGGEAHEDELKELRDEVEARRDEEEKR